MSCQGKFKEEIVISGLSGSFPLCDNVQEFKEGLFSKKNLVAFPEGLDEVTSSKPKGSIKSSDKFDNVFFFINNKQADRMEAVTRVILEKVFETIVDAGFNPNEFKETNTGVFIGSSYIEDQRIEHEINEYTALGRYRCLIANRISFWLDVKGPSYIVDTACSSSAFALEQAYRAIQDGICDAAIVGGINACTFDKVFEVFGEILSQDSKCKAFSDDANGFVRSEAVVTLLLQKKKDARRIYANLLHTVTKCEGYKDKGQIAPSEKCQIELYRNFYRDIDVDPTAINYIEAHGTGTKVGDVVELNGIEEFFCNERSEPLKVGSVKSNMGHSEGGAAACSVAKAIIAYETGLIPPNINFTKPNSRIPALHNGNIKVVLEPTPCKEMLIAVNSFGIGGANSHILLSPNSKEKNSSESPNYDFPILVTVSGRTEEAVNVLLNDLEQHKHDIEYVALYHRIFADNINGHLYRGYTILHKEEESFKINMHCPDQRRPIWFIFSGMGSQWPAMGRSLMKIPIFAESIYKSHETLKSKNLDLLKIITEEDPKIIDNILYCLVGISAIQIALVDLLRKIEIFPDGIIGHSLGETGCAYADGCMTAEQAILVSYYRGLVSSETKFIHGTMVAVGEGFEKMKDMVPPEIDIACHNSSSNCTISGPTENVEEFLVSLKEKNVFARTVNSANIAYHSRYISEVGPKFLSLLEKNIPEKKLRSEKWICTSAPESEWDNDSVKYCCPEYHTRNVLGPVLFDESSKHIPDNAIAIEIAPHGLLQAILKRSLNSTISNIPLCLKNHEDGSQFLLNSLGKLYTSGLNPKLYNLYPPIEFPVSRGTPMISHLIRWQHDEKWDRSREMTIRSGERDVIIDVNKPEHQYFAGHVIDGRNIFPATGYLFLVWETLAIMNTISTKDLPVVFEDVRFQRATTISKNSNNL